MKSLNNITLTGRLVKDAELSKNGKRASFSIAHNMGPKKPVYLDLVMFDNNHGRKVEIPLDLLKKGTPVEVNAYMRSNPYTNKDGKTIYAIQNVVKTVVPISEEAADAPDDNAGEDEEQEEEKEA